MKENRNTGLLFGELELKTLVIKSKRDFDSLFRNARVMQVITYVDSPELILEFFEKNGLSNLEIGVGESTDYREKLREKLEVADKLERLKEEGKLLIYTSKKVIHSKMYLAEYENGEIKFINTSANFTRNAQEASSQMNYAHIFTLDSKKSHYYQKFSDDINKHKREMTLFLEDLTEEIKRKEDEGEKRVEIIERWIIGEKTDAQFRKFLKLEQEISEKAITEDPNSTEIIVSLEGIDAKIKEKVYKDLRRKNISHNFQDNDLWINRLEYTQASQKSYGLPLMLIEGKKIKYIFNQQVIERTSPPSEKSEINQALEDLESYFKTVDKFGETNRSTAVKANMFEALFYFFWSPFANQQMEVYKHFGALADKGVPFLYIYGEPNSGKGSFIRFALRMITGKNTRSISANEVTPSRLSATQNWGTIFPLVVDDISSSKITRLREKLSNYWRDWDKNRFPTVIFTTNQSKPQDWLKERTLRVDFDIKFPEKNPRGVAAVNKILNQNNLVFCWFSYLYLRLAEDKKMEGDILAPVRDVFRELYERGDRVLPKYFPEKPVEKIYGVGRVNWLNLYREGMVQEMREDSKVSIKFKLEDREIYKYLRDLPSNVRAEKLGKKILIKNADSYYKWLQLEKKSVFGKFLAKLKRS